MSTRTTAATDMQAFDLRGGLFQLVGPTLASAVGFWAWMLISPIQRFHAEGMDLSEGQVSLMLATAVLVGAIGRIFTGALTDRFGARRMFTVMLLATVPAVLLVALAGSLGSFALLIVAGTYLGIGGLIFAVGIRRAAKACASN
ncbi:MULTISPECIES: MFS transporter [Glutamicibacter]|uniref:MFS transporter n=1 Tax=Glutamicibacter bergerei TaxID=256702 RepID=A0ABV9MJY5_9MICC|nr:hypothetical protein [Micrococcaceae bacterium]